jgi:hypothetical protein
MHKLLACTISSLALLPGCGSETEKRQMVAANVQAIELARRIQSQLASDRKCPAQLAGFNQPNGIGRFERKPTPDLPYWLHFKCQDDLTFDLTVAYSFDSGTGLSGRDVGPLEISYGHFSEARTLKVLPADDPALIAARVVREQ